MNTSTINTKVLSFGETNAFNVAVGDLNESVRHTLMQRTFSHIMGNEAKSVELRLKAEKNAKGEAKYNDQELADKIHDWRMAKIEAMENGEFSLRVVGPRLSSDERIAREFARDTLVIRMTAKKQAMPKASEKDAWDGLIDQFLAHPKGRELADGEIARRKAAVVDAEFDMDKASAA